MLEQSNFEFLEQLDTERISLNEYVSYIVERELVKNGILKTKSAETLLREL